MLLYFINVLSICIDRSLVPPSAGPCTKGGVGAGSAARPRRGTPMLASGSPACFGFQYFMLYCFFQTLGL